MFSKEFMKFLINYQSSESSPKNKAKKNKKFTYYSGRLATVLVNCSK